MAGAAGALRGLAHYLYTAGPVVPKQGTKEDICRTEGGGIQSVRRECFRPCSAVPDNCWLLVPLPLSLALYMFSCIGSIAGGRLLLETVGPPERTANLLMDRAYEGVFSGGLPRLFGVFLAFGGFSHAAIARHC